MINFNMTTITKVLYALNASCRQPTQYFAISQSNVPRFDLMSSITTGINTSPQNHSCERYTIPCNYRNSELDLRLLCGRESLKGPVPISKKDRLFERNMWRFSKKPSPLSFFQIVYISSWKGYIICKVHFKTREV